MNRKEMLDACKKTPHDWDVLIIGGGATGLGTAVDAASRGYRTLLLEQNDFAKGSSSRSTKLIHGGLRYLKQGHIGLVFEALRERGLLCQNAPHLVSPLGFIVPTSNWWERLYYGAGIQLYDLLAGKLKLEKSSSLTQKEALLRIPTLNPHCLRSAFLYYDGQFDDARLAISLAQTAVDHGAVVLNYCPVISFIWEKKNIIGVLAKDLETGEEYELRSKTIINATGIFSDSLRKMEMSSTSPVITLSQGIHLVLDRRFMPSDTAFLIPSTEDGRVLFCIPWHRHLLLGTTDTPIQEVSLEPKPLSEEIDFLLKHAARYLIHPPKYEDVLSVFAGLRPLVHTEGKPTSKISRNHEIFVSTSGLITIVGGKWTTYRKMAEDVIDRAIFLGKIHKAPCKTKHLPLHGYVEGQHRIDPWTMYGTDAKKLEKLCHLHPDDGHLLHPKLPYLPVEVIWAAQQEMARSVEDVLARRTRSLFLNVKASIDIAPRIASILAKELGKNRKWEEDQITQFNHLAKNYSFSSSTRIPHSSIK